jgi:hypothetical protein
MRTVAVLTALLLLAGCQKSPPPQAQSPPATAQTPPPPPPSPIADQAGQNPPAIAAGEAKDRFPLDQDQFKEGAMGKTRDEVHAKYGPPDELGEWGPSVGWDGPVSIYKGPFTSAGAEGAAATKAKARVYFRKSGDKSVAASVDFTNQ